MPWPSRATAPSPRRRTGDSVPGAGHDPWRAERLGRFEEGPRHRRTEHTVPLDLVMDRLQPSAVAVDGEVRHGPDDLAQEEDHGADVEELELQAFVPALHDLQARRPGLVGLDLVVPAVARIEGSQEVLADLDVGAAADVLREVGAPGCEHAGDLRPVDGGRVATGHQVERAVGEGQRRLLGHRRPRRPRADAAAPSPWRGWAAIPRWRPTSAGSSRLRRRRAPRRRRSGCPAPPWPRRACVRRRRW